jgi:hypothetical protein
LKNASAPVVVDAFKLVYVLLDKDGRREMILQKLMPPFMSVVTGTEYEV